MTSEVDALKTNEFLRRRKLRLQQVREQSKDIARKIRLRAKVENLRQIVDLENKKEQDHLQNQEKLVLQLEQLYSKSVQNIGAGHSKASDVNLEGITKKTDLSRLRGRKATAHLRQEKQQKLDERKKSLDRKLQAREAANELSREKSKTLTNKQQHKTSSKDCGENNKDSKQPEIEDLIPTKDTDNQNTGNKQNNKDLPGNENPRIVKKNDMATQWTCEGLSRDWELNIPKLILPEDGNLGTKESVDVNPQNKASKDKRLDLFALSEDMPSSLQSRITHTAPTNTEPVKSSLTLISEYLQNRNLRLREPDTPRSRTHADDLQSLKQTILRTRTSKTEGNDSVCKVHDVQVIPVPSWEAEGFQCTQSSAQHMSQNDVWKPLKPMTNSEINKIFSSIRPVVRDLCPTPVLRGQSPFKRNKICSRTFHSPTVTSRPDRNTKINIPESTTSRKSAVTIYNHSTRDSRNVPTSEENMVIRETAPDEDAYSQAMKESSNVTVKDKEHEKRLHDMRNKVAMTKQTVEKEYKDTMAFLNSLPKERTCKTQKRAFMNENRQQQLNENRQLKMEQEFRRIQNDYKLLKECCADRRNNNNPDKRRNKSPAKTDFAAQDFEYSWMPVPESDASLAIHTIPTEMKEGKSTVKFSNVDSYHEYRSRHKHTPPTKDTSGSEKQTKKVEKIIVQEGGDDSSDYSTMASESSSVENLEESKARKDNNSDAERIIIYKIIDSKNDKVRKKKKSKFSDNISEASARKINELLKQKDDNKTDHATSAMTVEQLKEGVYKTVSEKGDNIASMYFEDRTKNSTDEARVDVPSCVCAPKVPVPMQWDSGDVPARKSSVSTKPCPCVQKKESPLLERDTTSLTARAKEGAPSDASANSYKTTVAGKSKNEDDFVKLIDMAGQDNGKFYIGATGLLNNEGYEVIIQLRKKDAGKDEKRNDTEVIKESVAAIVDDQTKTNTQKVQDTVSAPNTTNKFENQEKLTTISPRPVEKSKLDHDESSGSLEMNVINYEDNSEQRIPTGSGGLENNEGSKTEPMRKISTSTHTQTTLNTPLQRPMFFHMSSSTSTTYMSPPDFIAPEYLKPDMINPQKINCKCRKCKARRSTESTENYVISSAKSKHMYLETPPTSVRTSKKSSDRRVYYESSGDGKKEESTQSSTIRTRRSKGRMSSQHSLRSKNSRHTSLNRSRRGSRDIPISKIQGKSNLKPVIQNYVKKLLTLSNEGFKAIEVVNQECSSVATPGSSIINIECNINKRKPSLANKISLEQLRDLLQHKINEKHAKRMAKVEHIRKPVHKIKSLNISKQLLRKKSSCEIKTVNNANIEKQTSSSMKDDSNNKLICETSKKQTKLRSKSSPTPRPNENVGKGAKSSLSDSTSNCTSALHNRANKILKSHQEAETIKMIPNTKPMSRSSSIPSHNTTDTSSSTYLSNNERHKHIYFDRIKKQKPAQDPMSISTQTGASVDSDINLIKLAESKLQNMEKIADLTEKCTQRIFNLGKVLEEVRKNRSNAYSHITTSDSSENELKSSKNTAPKSTSPSQDIEFDNFSKTEEDMSAPETSLHLPEVDEKLDQPKGFVSLLEGIPKPGPSLMAPSTSKPSLDKINIDSKARGRPPPALSRIHLKHGEEEMVPHELSTVIEVDSPMSVKLKSKYRNGNSLTSRNLDQSTEIKSTKESPEVENKNQSTQKTTSPFVNPDLLQSNVKLTKSQSKPRNSSQRLEMMDLQKFNDIMLKPFVTIEEFAKQCNVGVLDEGSNLEDMPRESAINDDLSSLHSEGSLPDVIGELLKRNIISEPFRFDTASNVNSATISSDSSLSVLALAKVARDEKNSTKVCKNKENIAEVSDAISNSSNPDLENAFKKLGMGWASSTLKRTKERLALSSSSNTSSSSISHKFNLKSFENKDESCERSNKPLQVRNENKMTKTVDQQTSLSKSMIVQEFLNNELAKRITFSNSHRNETETEFVSMYETKLPDQMKNTSIVREERSIDSAANPNRARTSTPVQLYKSMTYHSSSSSNNASNGFFSNLDDLSSVKGTSGSMRNHSTSDKDDLTIPNYSLRKKRRDLSELSKSDS